MADDDTDGGDEPRRRSRPGDDDHEKIREISRRIDRIEEDRTRKMETYLVDRAMLFGRDGQPGRVVTLENSAREISSRLVMLETWRTQVTAKMALAIAIGTPVGAVLTELVLTWIHR